MKNVLDTLADQGLLKRPSDVTAWAIYLQASCATYTQLDDTQYAPTPQSLKREAHSMLHVDMTDAAAAEVLYAQLKHCAAQSQW